MATNQFGKWGGTVPTLAQLEALDISQIADGAMAPVQENDGIYVLKMASTETVGGDRYLSTSTGIGRWHKVSGTGGGAIEIEYTEPDPINPDGLAVHHQEVTDPPYNITRVWNGSIWLVTAATPIHGEWGSAPPADGAMPGHIATDYTNRVRYEWMNDLASGYTWVNVGTF